MEALNDLITNYNAAREALPWLDCYVSELPAQFPGASTELTTDAVKLTREGRIRLVIQTEHSFEEIAAMAAAAPETNFILASGERKLLYHFAIIEKLLESVPNLYLANANFCSMLGLERLVAAGVGSKLLYGSMMPYLDAGQSRGPVILGHFDWATKCAIAGNNFRRLLGRPPVLPPEVKFAPVRPFIVDAHTHTVEAFTPVRFPAPGANADWEVWRPTMDTYGTEYFVCVPSDATRDCRKHTSRSLIAGMAAASGGRVRYLEAFDPRSVDYCVRECSESLADSKCVGLKIHPASHQTYASDERYAKAFELAGKFGKVVMTHSWGISDYNPTQKFSTPLLFDRHCAAYPDTKFVLGHMGGRPNGFPEAVEMCRKYGNVRVDLAGDFFHNGVIAAAVEQIGADKILFASDLFWIDPRCTLGMLLESALSGTDLMKILRTNALEFYLNA